MSENDSASPEQEQERDPTPPAPEQPSEEQPSTNSAEQHTAQPLESETQERSPVSKVPHRSAPPRPPTQPSESSKPAPAPVKEPNDSTETSKPAPQAQAPSKEASEPSSAPPGPEHPQETKAKAYLVQAEKKLKSAESFFGGLFGRAAKMEDAADFYVRAANAFKVAKKFKASGDAFCAAADVQAKLDVKHEAGTNLVEAGQVLKKEDPKRAAECYKQAAEIYTDMGRFSMAARYHNSIAEIYEGELVDYEQAITHYEQAADYYKGEDSTGSANRCLLKVAHMCAQLQQFDKAAGIFEEVGRSSLENTLLRYSAKEHFFKAGICRFCMGSEYVTDAIEGYKQIHPGFEGTRELKLLQDLLEAHSEEDSDKFSEIIKDYDAISRIDQWLTAQLLHIKKSIHPDLDIN